jgi:hypothetical protein
MKKTIPIILLLGCVVIAFAIGWPSLSQGTIWNQKPKSNDSVRVLVVTGGHDHDSDFYSAFDDENIR